MCHRLILSGRSAAGQHSGCHHHPQHQERGGRLHHQVLALAIAIYYKQFSSTFSTTFAHAPPRLEGLRCQPIATSQLQSDLAKCDGSEAYHRNFRRWRSSLSPVLSFYHIFFLCSRTTVRSILQYPFMLPLEMMDSVAASRCSCCHIILMRCQSKRVSWQVALAMLADSFDQDGGHYCPLLWGLSVVAAAWQLQSSYNAGLSWILWFFFVFFSLFAIIFGFLFFNYLAIFMSFNSRPIFNILVVCNFSPWSCSHFHMMCLYKILCMCVLYM